MVGTLIGTLVWEDPMPLGKLSPCAKTAELALWSLRCNY